MHYSSLTVCKNPYINCSISDSAQKISGKYLENRKNFCKEKYLAEIYLTD